MKVYIGPYADDSDDRPISVEVHEYDVWSMDHTLSYIIVPLLEELKQQNISAPSVQLDDVPEHLHPSTNESLWGEDVDDHWFDRWDYVLDTMIAGFTLIRDIDDMDWSEEDEECVREATRLFGKYYRSLWN